jgi:surface polysaccharide O-acyltransferase-like enzyme
MTTDDPSHAQASIAPPANPEEKAGKIHLDGFDYLRVFFMMMVLMGHSNLFQYMGVHRQHNIGPGPNVWDYLLYEVQSSAVPSFILMSMVLFSLRPPSWSRTVDRVKKLGYLYCFWVGAWVLYTRSTPEPGVLGWIEFFLRGGGWLFYTFASLMVLTPFCWMAAKLNRRWQWVGLVLSILVVIATALYVYDDRKWLNHHYYWVPSCFAMMPFVAAILVPHLNRFRESGGMRYKWIAVMLVAGFVAALVEWKFSAPIESITGERRWVPKHARLSMQFHAIALLILSLGVKKPVNRVVSFFARNSLGVYCLHPFILRGFIEPAQHLIGPYAPDLAIPVGCLVVAVFCSVVTEFLRAAFKHRLI